MKQKIILINGPKYSGKDYTAEQIDEFIPHVSKLKFATPMYEAIPRLFQISMERWEYLYNNEKETKIPELFDMSPRQAMIWLSEDVMKPKFGQNVFGVIASNAVVNAIEKEYEIITFSDSGFSEEAKTLVNDYGKENVYLIRIYAKDCDFRGDSRGYITPESIGIDESHFVEVYNDKTFNYDVLVETEVLKLLNTQ